MNGKTTPKIRNRLWRLAGAALVLLTLLAGFSASGRCTSRLVSRETSTPLREYPAQEQSGRRMLNAQHSTSPPDYQNLSPKQKQKFQRNMQEWESLPPQEQRTLRHRMEQWQGLSPEDRSLYRKRYNQYQRLPQEERKTIQEKLERPQTLSPREKEELREHFNQR
jgi:hypothetical protein